MSAKRIPEPITSNVVFNPIQDEDPLRYEIFVNDDFVGIYYPKHGSGDIAKGEADTTWLSPSSAEMVLTKTIKQALKTRFGPEAVKNIVVEE